MAERKFQPGFRLSALDVVVLVVAGMASAYAMTIDRWVGMAIAFVVPSILSWRRLAEVEPTPARVVAVRDSRRRGITTHCHGPVPR
jgi:hypothetical protein